MKHVAVLLCIFGLAAVCQATTTATATTDATTVTTVAATTRSVPGGPNTATTTAGSGTTASGTAAGGTAAGGVVTTDAGTGAGATTASTVSCLNCTGDDTSACGTGTGITTKVDCDACWVYREENASGNVTITRGCAQSSDTCTTQTQSEYCTTAGGITTCRQCCTTADCNGSGLTLTGNSGAGDVTASVVVTMATALFAILALWQ
ncbi:PREDICTED: jacalin-related lectin 34-like [Branchiostoma belcheri]|uniref:Jacalin-related lectin 34-like n=1 Tax=Branchiostoma belcheri TaxID=7741 RepID=A0A6P5AKS7_BRABE|nr:PREDICTED: jacalin-related lectin 34-like [Branchiostoma belcheri]